MSEKLIKNVTIVGHSGLCLRKPQEGKSHNYRDVIVFRREVPFLKCLSSTLQEKVAFSNSSGVKSVFEKFCLRDGLVWTVSPTVKIKRRFQISPYMSK